MDPSSRERPGKGESLGKRKRKPVETSPGAEAAVWRLRPQMDILHKLQQLSLISTNLQSFWKSVLDTLDGADAQEVPFAVIYSVSDGSPDRVDASASSSQGPQQLTPEKLHLEGV